MGHTSPCRARALCAASLLAIAACTGVRDSVDGTTRTDSAGVVIVLNDADDRELDWQFERIIDIGGDTGRTAFFRVFPASIGVDSTGNLYVLDAGTFSVSVFDRDGQYVRSFGRQGEGPGEMGFPSDMAVSADGRLAVHDFARRALLFYESDGTFAGTLPIPGPLQRRVALLDDGSTVVGVTGPADVADSLDYRVIVMSADTQELARVRLLSDPPPQQFACTSLTLPPYFGPRIVWAAASDRVVISDDAAYSIRVVDRDGSDAVWRRDVPPVRANLRLAAWEVAGGDSLRFRGPLVAAGSSCVIAPEDVAERVGYADVVPVVSDLVVRPGRGVWVRRRTEQPGELRIDVFDDTGAYVGTLPEGSPFPALFRGSDEIVTVERDSMDVPHVIVYRVRR